MQEELEVKCDDVKVLGWEVKLNNRWCIRMIFLAQNIIFIILTEIIIFIIYLQNLFAFKQNEKLSECLDIKTEEATYLKIQLNNLNVVNAQMKWKLDQSEELLEMVEQDSNSNEEKNKGKPSLFSCNI